MRQYISLFLFAALASSSLALPPPAPVPANDQCLNAIAFPPIDTAGASTNGTTTGAVFTAEPACPPAGNTAPNVWYSVIGTGNTMTATTCENETPDGAANYDSAITIYCGDCETPICVAANDDEPGCNFHSTVSWCSAPGVEYLIMMHGFALATGNFTLTVSDDGAPCTGAVACYVADCNSNGAPDDIDITAGTSTDCNTNSFPDECDIAGATSDDCNSNALPDECEDCNTNGIADECEVAPFSDSFEGGLPPGWTATGLWHATSACPRASTCDGAMWAYYGLDASCNFVTGAAGNSGTLGGPVNLPPSPNLVLSYCSAYGGEGYASPNGFDAAWVSVNGTLVDDVSVDGDQPDWETRSVDLSAYAGQAVTLSFNFDSQDFIANFFLGWQVDNIRISGNDCNANEIPDDCEITAGSSEDCNTNAVPDECEPDCNANAIPDDCDIAEGTSEDCNSNAIPDECEVSADCNANSVIDECDVLAGTSLDCNSNAVPDECEPDCNTNAVADECDITDGTSEDCNLNTTPDECELSGDCNANGVIDTCDIGGGTSVDCDNDAVPDECEPDCNENNVADDCDIEGGTSGDCDGDGVPNECDERDHPGWNWVDVGVNLTANQPTYWSVATGEPSTGGVAPFPILDPTGANGCPGRPANDGTNERVLRGFVVGWAVNANGQEIRWNHLKGDAVIINYDLGAAWEYSAYAFQAVNPAILNGGVTGTPGILNFDGNEYDRGYDLLLLDFLSSGTEIDGPQGVELEFDTDLTLMPLGLDVRQETDGPVTTKASFTVWNQNETKLTGMDRCVTCWDSQLVSLYGLPNHFLAENLQTDKGKAHIDGLASQNCDLDFDPGDACTQAAGGPNPNCDPRDVLSEEASLLGVAVKHIEFTRFTCDEENREGKDKCDFQSKLEYAGGPLIGLGFQDAVLQADIVVSPPPERPGGVGSTNELPDAVRPTRAVRGQQLPGGGQPPIALSPSDRASVSDKGSLLVFAKVELRWSSNGAELIQDTFLDLTNDFPEDVQVQFYFVNGDAETP